MSTTRRRIIRRKERMKRRTRLTKCSYPREMKGTRTRKMMRRLRLSWEMMMSSLKKRNRTRKSKKRKSKKRKSRSQSQCPKHQRVRSSQSPKRPKT